MVAREQLIESLKKVFDPEINIDVWTLGLIYDLKIEKDVVKVKMTLTTPMCPYGPALIDAVKEAVKKVKDVKDASVEVVFEPPWAPSTELKLVLGIE
ncbi:MAG: iron-sulfur cluster assembly protein [Nanoarchaeota archaeon]